ncbi:WD40/YVTN/BNR-like repeat-containing protein [Nitrospira sp. NS4]|uniref:WD40/YVTN/BNR-like repeat-containing protein n=1 Tax=Nitrospira sp. NS4 TaxID=3414498 RepID=UPI003C2E0F74
MRALRTVPAASLGNHAMLKSLSVLLLVALSLAGCNRSDPIVVIQLHPKNPDIIYVATNDYIYKTRDGGQTWANLSRGMSHSRVICMAIDAVYPATVYAGTKGDAVYKSYDGGQRWVSQRSGLDDATISSVVNQFVIDPDDNTHLFAATTMGVFESKNAGDSWTKRMEGMKEVLMVVSLEMDPTRPSILYAGTSGGVYKSIDQAGHWEKVNNGLVPPEMVKSSRALNVTAIEVDAFEPETVYAATLAGLYKSTDGAKSWVRIGELLADQMIISMLLDRSKKGVVYITGREGVHRSEDGGVTWKAMNAGFATTNIRSLAQSQTDPRLFYAGTNGSGLYRSKDAGESWEVMPPVVPTNS